MNMFAMGHSLHSVAGQEVRKFLYDYNITNSLSHLHHQQSYLIHIYCYDLTAAAGLYIFP